MKYNIEFQISALVFLLLIIGVFLHKNRGRAWTPDSVCFARMSAFALLLTVDDIVCPILLAKPEAPVCWKLATGKLYIILMFLCMFQLLQYTIYLAMGDRADKAPRKVRVLYRASLWMGVFLAAVSACLPLYYRLGEGTAYVYGPCQDLCYGAGAALAVVMPLFTFGHRRHSTPERRAPIYAYVLIEAVTAALENWNKELLLTSLTLVVTIVIIYFTLQNPDIFVLMERNRKISDLSEQMIYALLDTVDAKDHYTKGHSLRVAAYAVRIARRMGYDEGRLRELYYMGLLHDIGKIGIPDEIINKPGGLTEQEYAVIRGHTTIGGEMLSRIQSMPGLYVGAACHHERWDGKGYPRGLAGEDIPEPARILSVADVYDAMASVRSYRSILPQKEVRRAIKKGRGTQFDPKIANVMLALIDEDKEYRMSENAADENGALPTQEQAQRNYDEAAALF